MIKLLRDELLPPAQPPGAYGPDYSIEVTEMQVKAVVVLHTTHRHARNVLRVLVKTCCTFLVR